MGSILASHSLIWHYTKKIELDGAVHRGIVEKEIFILEKLFWAISRYQAGKRPYSIGKGASDSCTCYL